MNALRLFFFAQFFLVAVTVPAMTIPGRYILPRLGKVFALFLIALLPILGAVKIWLPEQPLMDVVHMQLLLTAFAMAVAGLALLMGRYCLWGGPVVVTLLAVAVLTTPFWGDAAFHARWEPLARFSRQWLVSCNPLFNVSAALGGFDWMHTHVIYGTYGGYKLTRLGEDFAYSPARTWVLGLLFTGIGLMTSGLAGLTRPRGRSPDFMVGADRFC